MSRSKVVVCICTLGVLLAFSASAQAVSYTVYFGEDLGNMPLRTNSDAARNAFMANLVGVGTEDFESFSDGAGAPLTVDFGYAQATLSGGGRIQSGYSVGRYPISGSKYWETSQNFSIQFSEAQAAFGFYGTDIGDHAGQITLTLVSGETTFLTVPNTIYAPNASVLYYGVIADTDEGNFTRINFGTTSGSDWFGFDDMTIGEREHIQPPIPEPLTMLCVISGLGGLGAYIRRRRVA